MRLAALIHKPKYGATAMSAETVIRMATTEGTKTLGLDKKIGTIEPGKYADLVFLKNNELQTIPFEIIYSKIVYSITGRSVKHVLIDGRWIVRDHILLTYDEETLNKEVYLNFGKKYFS